MVTKVNNFQTKIYTARPVRLALGTSKGSTTIYAELKNKSVWAFTAPNVTQAKAWIKFIEASGTITLTKWKRVRKAPAQPARKPLSVAKKATKRDDEFLKADLEHAMKMAEFEMAGDKQGAIEYLNARIGGAA